MNKANKWNRVFDWGSDELLDMRWVGGRAFQFVLITDMEACCGSDNDGHPKYHAEVDLVDLAELPDKEVASAIESCGWEDMGADDAQIAEACRSYGLKAPLWQEASNNWNNLLREGRREANSLLDSDALADAMDKPVNGIGSTAAEFMRGDITSAMSRGVVAGDPTARIMAKMYGASQEDIDAAENPDFRPDDFLPYVMGYMAAMAEAERETGDDLAPEYGHGYDRGVRTRTGKIRAPSWIKQR